MILDNEDIVKLINDYERESKAFKEEILRICWHMRGGVTYDEAMQMSHIEREIINDIVKENYETTKKSGLPHF